MTGYWLPALALVTAGMAQDGAAGGDSLGWGAMGPWGQGSRNVTVENDGRVTISYSVQLPADPPSICPPSGPDIVDPPCPESRPARTATRRTRFSIGAKGYAEIRALLAPLEKRAGVKGRCVSRIYDAGSAWVSWRIHGRDRNYQLGEARSAREVRWSDALAKAAENRLTEMAKAATDYNDEEIQQ